MSNRTANSIKAITLRWTQEQQLVSEGKGTRDWTPEQQRDILDRGKAYDDNGKAFEGHHMKSVERFPEYQGDFENIQFLSRPEHNAAHNGSFQNPTNGYFNPFTGETTDFGDNRYELCAITNLSEPIFITDYNNNKVAESADSPQEVTPDAASPQTTSDLNAVIREETHPIYHKTHPSASTSEKTEAAKSGFRERIKHIARSIKDFSVRHPVVSGIAMGIGVVALGYLADRAASHGSGSGSNSFNYFPSTSSSDEYNSHDYFDSDESGSNEIDTNTYPEERSSPREHDVSGYDRQQNGKTVHVNHYKRGGSKD